MEQYFGLEYNSKYILDELKRKANDKLSKRAERFETKLKNMVRTEEEIGSKEN